MSAAIERHGVRWTVREPGLQDADELGRIHVAAWKAAYRGGLMPDAYLDALDPVDRAEMWRAGLERPVRDRRARWVAEDESGLVRGFILLGPAENDDAAVQGEVFALNVHPEAWSSGAGRELMGTADRHFRRWGWSSGILWVHPRNDRAIAFYERCGWLHDGVERTVELLGVSVPETRLSKRVASD